MNQPTLKPCPFCGGEAKIYKGEPVEGKPDLPSFIFIFCNECRGRTGEYYDKETAIAKWNERVTQ